MFRNNGFPYICRFSEITIRTYNGIIPQHFYKSNSTHIGTVLFFTKLWKKLIIKPVGFLHTWLRFYCAPENTYKHRKEHILTILTNTAFDFFSVMTISQEIKVTANSSEAEGKRDCKYFNKLLSNRF